MTTMDQESADHMATWIGFTRLLKWGLAGVILVLVVLALITL
ncbi:MAG TPA: aa3-type cytochrome c oxidase subunit IV [Stellaceae bacterium]|nr:aa3-type cytochrome c oxidase subunit IV [Stellaceae bacterium]